MAVQRQRGQATLGAGFHGGAKIKARCETGHAARQFYNVEVLGRVGDEMPQQARGFDQVVDGVLRVKPASKGLSKVQSLLIRIKRRLSQGATGRTDSSRRITPAIMAVGPAR